MTMGSCGGSDWGRQKAKGYASGGMPTGKGLKPKRPAKPSASGMPKVPPGVIMAGPANGPAPPMAPAPVAPPVRKPPMVGPGAPAFARGGKVKMAPDTDGDAKACGGAVKGKGK